MTFYYYIFLSFTPNNGTHLRDIVILGLENITFFQSSEFGYLSDLN